MNESRELTPELSPELSPEFLDALRALASGGPRGAPPEIEERLVREFRRRNNRRKRMLWIPALGAAAAAAAALLVWSHSQERKLSPAIVAPVAAAVEEDADAAFYPLPEAEGLPALETAMVVRVQLPVSSLQLMGVPVAEERADSSVQADLLLGQDGLARAVRLAQ
jgi:hypothetical protein